jgi:hypothetical protein
MKLLLADQLAPACGTSAVTRSMALATAAASHNGDLLSVRPLLVAVRQTAVLPSGCMVSAKVRAFVAWTEEIFGPQIEALPIEAPPSTNNV